MMNAQEPAASRDPSEIDWETAYTCFPPIDRRYLASGIDGTLVLIVIISVAMTLQSDSTLANAVKWVVSLSLVLGYKPVLTSRAATVGQVAMKVRVRRLRDGERIGIADAYMRFLVKLLLGFVSFFSIPFTPRRQGLHDLVVASVVLDRREVARYKSLATVRG